MFDCGDESVTSGFPGTIFPWKEVRETAFPEVLSRIRDKCLVESNTGIGGQSFSMKRCIVSRLCPFPFPFRFPLCTPLLVIMFDECIL